MPQIKCECGFESHAPNEKLAGIYARKHEGAFGHIDKTEIEY